MSTIHIMSRDEDKIEDFIQKGSYSKTGKTCTICFRQMFKDIVTSELFTVKSIEYVGDIKIKEEEVIYHLSEEGVDMMYHFMEGDIHKLTKGNEIVTMLSHIWEKNTDFQEMSYPYYFAENKRELEEVYKVFYNYKNNIEIDSVWNFYRYKITEMYKPIRNKILNLYKEDLYETDNPFQYQINGSDTIVTVVFHDKKYQPEKVIL